MKWENWSKTCIRKKGIIEAYSVYTNKSLFKPPRTMQPKTMKIKKVVPFVPTKGGGVQPFFWVYVFIQWRLCLSAVKERSPSVHTVYITYRHTDRHPYEY